ncbi:MAG: TetR/AcrR family transcriptional regulator [Vulcanibacillus sp.]|jgi:AcrR family transcriptional regulator
MYLSRQSKEEQIREEALLAAQKLFQQFGLHKTTMEDIAKVMGKGKSTLYYYYKSKEEIFNDVVMREIDEVFNKTRSEIEKVTSAEEKLKTYFSVSIRTIKRKVILYKIIQGEVFEKLSPVDLLIKKFNMREIQSVKEILLLGIKNKEFPAFFEVDSDLLAYSAVSAIRSLTIDLAIEDKFPNWDERLNILINLIISGLKNN